MSNKIYNPSNPGLRALDNDGWQKLVVLLMRKFNATDVTITSSDILSLNAEKAVPFLITDISATEIKLVLRPSEAEGLEYVAKRQGKG